MRHDELLPSLTGRRRLKFPVCSDWRSMRFHGALQVHYPRGIRPKHPSSRQQSSSLFYKGSAAGSKVARLEPYSPFLNPDCH